MVVSLIIKDDLRGAIALLKDIEKKHIPKATAKAMTWSVKDAQKEITREIPRVFDRPISKTKTSVRAITADVKDWPNLIATVAIKDEFFTGVPAEKWLQAQTRGGARKHKRFESALISSGHMPSGVYAVPSRRLRLNQFGNVARGLHTRILSQVRSGIDPTQYRRQGDKAKFFSLPKGSGKLPAGIWERKGKGKRSFITLIFAFVRAPRYRKRLRFWRIAESTALQRLPINFRKGIRQELAMARRRALKLR